MGDASMQIPPPPRHVQPHTQPPPAQCSDVSTTHHHLSFMSALKATGNNSSSNSVVTTQSHANGVKTECLDPYHIPPRYQTPLNGELISPHKELKNLMKEVEISNVANTPTNHSSNVVNTSTASHVNNGNHDFSPVETPVIDK